ncbi:MAG TPA: hypothetical protein VFZ62_02525 [Candidatus Saccharimonadales bacterium]
MTVIDVEREATSPENGYGITREQAAKLARDLLEERPPEGGDRFVCYKIDGNDRFADIGRQVECEVFNEAFGNDPEEMREEYGPYEDQSTFFISIDRETGVPTGVLRIIRNGEGGFKSLNDLEGILPDFSQEEASRFHGIDNPDECWDIGTVAVPPEFRAKQGGVSLQLYRGMYVASQQEGIKHFVSVIDERPFEKMTKFLGFPFEVIHGGRPFSYLGSEKSLPVYGDAPEFEKAVRRKERTFRGFLARKALAQLGRGTKDGSLQF